jgi:hypothetical protein
LGLCIGRSAAGLIGAILTRNLGNVIINAAVDGTRNFIVALGAGAGAIVSGIESAQLGITTALATEPPPATAADIPGLRTLAVGRTFSLGAASSVVTDAAVSAPQDEATGETDVVATGADAEPQDPLKAPAVTDVSPSSDISRDAPEPAALPKMAVDATLVKGCAEGGRRDCREGGCRGREARRSEGRHWREQRCWNRREASVGLGRQVAPRALNACCAAIGLGYARSVCQIRRFVVR